MKQLDAAFRDLPADPVTKLEIGGVVLRESSSLRELRAACSLVGIGQSGGKSMIWKRLVANHSKNLLSVQYQEMIESRAEHEAPRELPLPRALWRWSYKLVQRDFAICDSDTLFRILDKESRKAVFAIHVDDMLFAGNSSLLDDITAILKTRYKTTWERLSKPGLEEEPQAA